MGTLEKQSKSLIKLLDCFSILERCLNTFLYSVPIGGLIKWTLSSPIFSIQ